MLSKSAPHIPEPLGYAIQALVGRFPHGMTGAGFDFLKWLGRATREGQQKRENISSIKYRIETTKSFVLIVQQKISASDIM